MNKTPHQWSILICTGYPPENGKNAAHSEPSESRQEELIMPQAFLWMSRSPLYRTSLSPQPATTDPHSQLRHSSSAIHFRYSTWLVCRYRTT
jgi:hypothetical protein